MIDDAIDSADWFIRNIGHPLFEHFLDTYLGEQLSGGVSELAANQAENLIDNVRTLSRAASANFDEFISEERHGNEIEDIYESSFNTTETYNFWGLRFEEIHVDHDLEVVSNNFVTLVQEENWFSS